MNTHWASKKRKAPEPPSDPRLDDDDEGTQLPLILPKFGQATSIYSHMNHIYFNDDVTDDSMFALNKELRMQESKLLVLSITHGIPPAPLYLHITTNGGSIHAAFSAVDCIQSLKVPVYTVVDGFVASAGTLLSLAGEKRYIRPNAYMLIHELRSSCWGKMSSIDEEYANLKKVMEHLVSYYVDRSRLTRKQLDKILKQDVIWNAAECIEKGIVDEEMPV